MTPSRSASIEAMVPGSVVYEHWGDGDVGWLLDPEPELVTGAVAGRTSQFAAGRRCARLAIADLGGEPGPIMRSTGRAPLWPDDLYGSISHTEGYAVAVAGRPDTAITSVGIDAERTGRVDEHLHERLFVDTERQWLSGLPCRRRAAAATALFGLKEAFYKAQFPLTGSWVGFHDVVIEHRDEHWVLAPATDLEALDAVTWPCEGRSLVQRGIAVASVAVRAG